MKVVILLTITAPVAFALPQAQTSSTSPDDATLIASISSAVAAAGLKPYATPLASDEITEWNALGDSFTTGIGSNGGDDFIGISQDCRRYKQAYPMQMNADTRWPGNPADRTLNFGACTGNKMEDVRNYQVSCDVPVSLHVVLTLFCSFLIARLWTTQASESPSSPSLR